MVAAGCGAPVGKVLSSVFRQARRWMRGAGGGPSASSQALAPGRVGRRWRSASTGHSTTHCPQPVQRALSMIGAATGTDRVTASCGHASLQREHERWPRRMRRQLPKVASTGPQVASPLTREASWYVLFTGNGQVTQHPGDPSEGLPLQGVVDPDSVPAGRDQTGFAEQL